MARKPTAVCVSITDPGGQILQAALPRFDVRLVVTREESYQSDWLPSRIAEDAAVPWSHAPITDSALQALIRALEPDLIIVGFYHARIPPPVIGASRLASVNLHPSLLPKYRGAMPIHWPVINGESRTGLTLHLLSDRFDEGDILWQNTVSIGNNETFGDVQESLVGLAGAALDHLCMRTETADFCGTVQEETKATFAPRICAEDRRLDWSQPARVVHDKVRGLCPRPLASLSANGQHHTVQSSRMAEESTGAREPGCVLLLTEAGHEARVCCGDGGEVILTGIFPALSRSCSVLTTPEIVSPK